MNQRYLEIRLKELPLGGIRFFHRLTSTNEEAASWIKQGCPDFAVVVADEQTAGRGRDGHRWYTPAGSALAFSIVLLVEGVVGQFHEYHDTTRLYSLGALAVCRVLQKKYQLPAKIKWPNDVLVDGKKLSGVLVENQWSGNEFVAAVLGIGINVATSSVPPANWDRLNPKPYPATCIETVLDAPVDRWELFHDVIRELLFWHERLSMEVYLQTLQDNLAYLGEWVQISSPGVDESHRMVRIIALEVDGALRIQEKSGQQSSLRIGEIHPTNHTLGGYHLRPVDSTQK